MANFNFGFFGEFVFYWSQNVERGKTKGPTKFGDQLRPIFKTLFKSCILSRGANFATSRVA